MLGHSWNELATTDGQTIDPNELIQPLDPLSGQPHDATTIMHGIRNSGYAYDKYANDTIIGSKTVNCYNKRCPQLGFLVLIKHSNKNVLPSTVNITDIKKYPYLKMRKLNGDILNTKIKHLKKWI